MTCAAPLQTFTDVTLPPPFLLTPLRLTCHLPLCRAAGMLLACNAALPATVAHACLAMPAVVPAHPFAPSAGYAANTLAVTACRAYLPAFAKLPAFVAIPYACLPCPLPCTTTLQLQLVYLSSPYSGPTDPIILVPSAAAFYHSY